MIETARRSPSPKLARLLDTVFSTPGTFERAEKRLRDAPDIRGDDGVPSAPSSTSRPTLAHTRLAAWLGRQP